MDSPHVIDPADNVKRAKAACISAYAAREEATLAGDDPDTDELIAAELEAEAIYFGELREELETARKRKPIIFSQYENITAAFDRLRYWQNKDRAIRSVLSRLNGIDRIEAEAVADDAAARAGEVLYRMCVIRSDCPAKALLRFYRFQTVYERQALLRACVGGPNGYHH